MRRQFDIFVLSPAALQPTIEDPALGWFFGEDFSTAVDEFDAEWVLMISPDIRISADFLNRIADACAEFPFADAFAPRIIRADGGNVISSGSLLHRKNGFEAEFLSNRNGEIRPVASLSPRCGIYSSRLLKSLGGFDHDFKTEVRFFDLGLRALHLGAHLFAMPNLCAVSAASGPAPSEPRKILLRETARACYKNLDIFRFLKFTAHHPSTCTAIFNGRKELDRKSLEATQLSRMTEEVVASVSVP